jgi:hypothetical protein
MPKVNAMQTERNPKPGGVSRGALALLVAFGSACSASPPPSPAPSKQSTPKTLASPTPPTPAKTQTAADPEAASGEPVLLVTNPDAMAALERKGFAVGDVFGERGTGPVDNARLALESRYASMVDVIAADVATIAQRDPQAGVGVHRFSHRLFDVRWLRQKSARFELVAIVNRMDRAPFHPQSCGETRLVFRLSYVTKIKDTPVSSRLPMTLGLEIPTPMPKEGCAAMARRWMSPEPLAADALVAWLTRPGGPLDRTSLAFENAQLVVNVQQLRWPSAVRPDLAGHAEYLLRAFRLDASRKRFESVPLENTPDVSRLSVDPALRKDFTAWLALPTNLASVDRGTALVPERFLAKRAVSVTPRGLARKANRPFASVFAPSDFASLPLGALASVRSPEALLRRLDGQSCQGCHEARSIAGFHLLGDDPATMPAGNAVATGASPHLAGDLGRRRSIVRSILAGSAKTDLSQPFAERSDYSGYGAHCGLGSDPSFAEWKCAAGLVCQPYDAPAGGGVGQCLPAEPRGAGDPCEAGPLDPKRDRVAKVERKACGGSAVCNTNAVGFPGGMCTETCSALSPSAVCGNIAILDPFNACVARGEPFLDCLANNVRPAGLRACDAENPCRDDYICTRVGGGPSGACIPPYFLFQLRVDGHP